MRFLLLLSLMVSFVAYAEDKKEEAVNEHEGQTQNADGSWTKVDSELKKGGKNIRNFLFSEDTNKEFEDRKAKHEAEEAKKKKPLAKKSGSKAVNEANDGWNNAIGGVNKILKTQKTDEGDKKAEEKKSE